MPNDITNLKMSGCASAVLKGIGTLSSELNSRHYRSTLLKRGLSYKERICSLRGGTSSFLIEYTFSRRILSCNEAN